MKIKYEQSLTIFFFCGGESSCGVGANVLDCDVIVTKFKLQWYYYIHFSTNILAKGMKTLIPQAI